MVYVRDISTINGENDIKKFSLLFYLLPFFKGFSNR